MIKPREFEGREMLLVGDWRRYAAAYAAAGQLFTGVVRGEIAGCAGLIPLWPGVAEAWMVSTALFTRYPKTIHRGIAAGLATLAETMGLHRIQAAVHQEHRVSLRWLRRLGFRLEGTLRRYGPDGADYLRLARLMKWPAARKANDEVRAGEGQAARI